MRYNALKILKEGLTGNKGWKPVWREPEPKARIRRRHHRRRRPRVWRPPITSPTSSASPMSPCSKRAGSGRGNVGRNTTIIRSNYLLPGNQPFYEFSLKLWEGLEQDFNYNAMVTQRGVLNLYHSDAQRDAYARRGNAMHLSGADAELLDRDGRSARCAPFLDFDNARFPIQGGLWQARGGTVRHDAVAWGYARGADRKGVDIIQNCEVTGFRSRTASATASRPRAARSAPRRSPSASPAPRRA